MRKNIRRKHGIDPDTYVNKLTGETMRSELGDVDTVSKVVDRKIDVGSRNFFIIDYDAFRNVSRFLSPAERDKLMILVSNIKGDSNYVCKEGTNTPICKADLPEMWNCSRSRIDSTIATLSRVGVLGTLTTHVGRKRIKSFVINPYLARRQPLIQTEAAEIFDNVRKIGWVEDMKQRGEIEKINKSRA